MFVTFYKIETCLSHEAQITQNNFSIPNCCSGFSRSIYQFNFMVQILDGTMSERDVNIVFFEHAWPIRCIRDHISTFKSRFNQDLMIPVYFVRMFYLTVAHPTSNKCSRLNCQMYLCYTYMHCCGLNLSFGLYYFWWLASKTNALKVFFQTLRGTCVACTIFCWSAQLNWVLERGSWQTLYMHSVVGHLRQNFAEDPRESAFLTMENKNCFF